MIKIDKSSISIEGMELVIRAEFSMLVRTLYENEILTREEIEEGVETGFMSDEELDKRTMENMTEFLNRMKKR